jgi:hypothetical protein
MPKKVRIVLNEAERKLLGTENQSETERRLDMLAEVALTGLPEEIMLNDANANPKPKPGRRKKKDEP